MINLQVYIKNKEGVFEQIELYNDESVTITQSLQNITDISKIFTDFSKTFSVPASKKNNKILRHFYSAYVSSYNLGTKLEAKLYLNHQFFKKGKVALEGATMKDNKAITYKITFFGDTIKLPDLIGKDTLKALTLLSQIDFEYSSTTVKAYLQNGLDVTANGETFTDAVIVPLISHTRRLFYDSTQDVEGSGNLHYGSENKGVLFNDLKPAIRVHFLIRAIENQYNINFDSSFFNPSNEIYYDLYMWMHVNKGKVLVDLADVSQAPLIPFKDFQNITNPLWNSTEESDSSYISNDYWYFSMPENSRYTFDVNVITECPNYNLFVYRDGVLLDNIALYNVSGNQQISNYTGGIINENLDSSITSGKYQVFIQSVEDSEFECFINLAEHRYAFDGAGLDDGQFVNQDETFSEQTEGSWQKVEISNFRGFTSSSDRVNFNAQTQVPDINVLDFLTGLFKMFNLTAFVDDNDIINVTPLDTFYENSKNTWDITPYLDTTDSSVSKLTPYKSLKFEYEGLNTFFAKNHKAFFGVDWGTEIYNNPTRIEGETYNVSVPFEHHKFERLINSDDVITDVQWGWSVDDDLRSVVGKPLIFYTHKVTSGTAISFQESESTKQSLSQYYIPLNHRLPTTDSQTLHFSLEPSEYAIGADQKPFTKSLYSEFYSNYVSDTFNSRRRLYTFQAYLPLRVLLNLNLADRIVIYDTLYKINVIKTNFATGISSLELINEVQGFKLKINEDDFADTVDKPYLRVDTTAVKVDNTGNSI